MRLRFVRGFFLGYKLPETLRTSLRKPIGKLFTGNTLNAARNAKNYILLNNPRITIAIGDYCAKTLIDVEFLPDIVIYDGKTLREKEITLNLDSYDEKSVINPREWILTVAWDVIEKAIAFCTKQINVSDKCRVAVRIDGEEDLLVIPTIISLPIGSVIVYGQPPLINDEGIVVVLITPSLKKLGHELLEKFEFHEEFINGNNYH